jgi:hypothetical protein
LTGDVGRGCGDASRALLFAWNSKPLRVFRIALVVTAASGNRARCGINPR